MLVPHRPRSNRRLRNPTVERRVATPTRIGYPAVEDSAARSVGRVVEDTHGCPGGRRFRTRDSTCWWWSWATDVPVVDARASAIGPSGLRRLRVASRFLDADERQLVAVVVQVEYPPTGDGLELADHSLVGDALELDRADDVASSAGVEPSLHKPEQALWVTDDVDAQPVDRRFATGSRANAEPCCQRTPCMRPTWSASGALSTATTDAPVCASSHVQPPGLAPRSRQVSPALGQRRIRTNDSYNLRYARLGGPPRFSTTCASPFGNGLEQSPAASIRSGSSNVHDPSGASGTAPPIGTGLADTDGSFSAISLARPAWSGATAPSCVDGHAAPWRRDRST